MKKKLVFVLVAFLTLLTLCACSKEPDHKERINEIVKSMGTKYYSYSITKLKGHEAYIIDFYNWDNPQSHTIWSDCHQNNRQLICLETKYYN